MHKIWAILAAALSLVGSDALAAQNDCPMVAARYGLIGYPEFTASFQPTPSAPGWESDVALRVVVDDRFFWFMFDQSGISGDVSLVRTSDPSSPGWRPPSLSSPNASATEASYYRMDADLNIRSDAPRAGDAAPAYILAPDLTEVIADDPGAAKNSRVRMPKALFKLTYCQSQLARAGP